MSELKLRLARSGDDQDHTSKDLIVRFDAEVTVGSIADLLTERFLPIAPGGLTVQRLTRGEASFSRGAVAGQIDLRNGDTIALGPDSGHRDPSERGIQALVRVLDGPNAGASHPIGTEPIRIGRSASCDLQVAGERVSRHHATLEPGNPYRIVDPGSTNGLTLNGDPVDGQSPVLDGDQIGIGDTRLSIEILGRDNPSVHLVNNAVRFNRPPRIDRPFQPVTVELPSPPSPPQKAHFPWPMAIIPIFMAAGLYAITRNVASMAFIAMSPLMVMGSYWQQKRSARATFAEATSEFGASLANQKARLDAYRSEEIDTRHRLAPSHLEVAAFASGVSPRLWEREPSDSDFGSLRVGLLPQTSAIRVKTGHGGSREQRLRLEELAAAYETLPPVPSTIDARFGAPVAVAGPAPLAEAHLRSLLVSASILHSPADLVIAAALGAETAPRWDWLKWLPHTTHSGLDGPLIAVGEDRSTDLLASLATLVSTRLDDDSEPLLLVLIDGSLDLDRSRLAPVLDHGSAAGISALWLTDDERRVPNACRTVLAIDPATGHLVVGDAAEGTRTDPMDLETVSIAEAERLARSLSAVIDVSAGGAATSEVPAAVSLVSLLGGPSLFDSPDPVLERWARSREYRHLGTPVGAYEGGPLEVDLRIDGPHGLIGGTTGSGKSEFLQALIVGLAAGHGPDRVNFLLIDYKGGSAFAGLVDERGPDGRIIRRGLPHTVGMITDLTPALAQRALVSLRAELARRENILLTHRAKDLSELESVDPIDAPPSLVIVIDEFAALAKEVPEFVDGVVDIAQRGRSLGLHLILATQKPGGVITPAIQANTNLRVALRMADTNESIDVIDSPEAGKIDRSTPGRGMIRRGPTDLIRFQSAYLGGATRQVPTGRIEIAHLDLTGPRWLDTGTGHAPPPTRSETDLARLVRLIGAAADSENHPAPRRPWLDPLPTQIALEALAPDDPGSAFVLGLADHPDTQSQGEARFGLDDQGSLLIFGTGGTGKSLALRTIAASLSTRADQHPVQIYGLDFAGRGLDRLSVLPTVGSIIGASDYERLTRLLGDLETEIAWRSDRFAAVNASTMTEFRTRLPDDRMARLVVLLDGYDNFTAAYETKDRGRWFDLLPRLVSDGRRVGVHFFLTGTRRASFPITLSSSVGSRMIFHLATEDEYHSVGADPAHFDASAPPGRCRLDGIEVQIAVAGGSPSGHQEAAALGTLAESLRSRMAPVAPIRVLPSEIRRSALPDGPGLRWALTDGFASIGPDLAQNLLITGRPRSGKTTALLSLAEASQSDSRPSELFAFDTPSIPDFAALADRLSSNPNGVVFIDEIDRVAGTEAEIPLGDALANGLRVVATADGAGARSYDPVMRTIRSRGDALVLQPDPDSDPDLLGGPIPRTSRRFGPGRGYLNLGGQIELVQIALPDSD